VDTKDDQKGYDKLGKRKMRKNKGKVERKWSIKYKIGGNKGEKDALGVNIDI
jgi:hypothetical protein